MCFSRQTLSTKETRALVRAMESHVEVVALGNEGEVSLDIKALTQYSGQGKCEAVIFNETSRTYREKLRACARRVKWDVINGMNNSIMIKRKSIN